MSRTSENFGKVACSFVLIADRCLRSFGDVWEMLLESRKLSSCMEESGCLFLRGDDSNKAEQSLPHLSKPSLGAAPTFNAIYFSLGT